MKKLIILSFLLFSNTTLAVDYTFSIKTPENSVSNNEVSSISSTKVSDFSTSVFSSLSSTLSQYLSLSELKAPTLTILKDVGSGTYNTPAGVKSLKIKMIGGGAGGSGTSIGVGTSGENGYPTLFGSILMAGGGIGNPNLSGAEGSISSPATGFIIKGALGGGKFYNGTSPTNVFGNAGGSNPLGFGVQRVSNSSASYSGVDALSNTGGGGGGATGGGATNRYGGSGGGSGAYVEAIITDPEVTYNFTIGRGGFGSSGVGAGTSVGGDGGSGVIIIEEHYK